MRDWVWLAKAREPVEVINRTELWGRGLAEVVVPSSGRRLRVLAEELVDLASRRWSEAELLWRAAATKALAVAADGEPLVVARGGVTLLPHQSAALQRAMALEPIRLAICDEVGLGKTITAGAILSELKARGRIQRVVVVAPKGVQLQWVAEMSERFGEEFVRVGPEGLPVDAGLDPWRAFDQVVCSLDAVKPLRRRNGWSAERLEEHNRSRFRSLVEAGWDLVIIDEAHHVAGSSEDVARHQLAVELCASAPNVLLLSATPHSGKSDGFRRFLGLIDTGFIEGRAIQRTNVTPIVIRTEKRKAVDGDGRPLFQPRVTEIRIAPYAERELERELYDTVTQYVRHGWDAARRGGRNSAAFLVLLMQRLVSSSTAAILGALEKRSSALGKEGEPTPLFIDRGEDWAELTGEEQYEMLTTVRGPAWASERAEVIKLLKLAREASAAGADAKAKAFFDLLAELRATERDPKVKILVFTEFLPTQEMLLGLLENAGIPAVGINGTMGLAERALAQEAFRNSAQVLVSTDAGGEGINLQFAHVVVNWDLPWSPSRLEQRIGRVDRIGQVAPVRAFNLVCEHSVELRVLEVLNQKLEIILAELGADKRGDVLESASRRSDELWTAAILAPETLASTADQFADGTRNDLTEAAPLAELLASPALPVAPVLPGQLRKLIQTASQAKAEMGCRLTSPLAALEHLPEIAFGEPCPVLEIATEAGWLAIWEVSPDGRNRSAISIYHPDRGLVRPDLARQLWDRCCSTTCISSQVVPSATIWDKLMQDGVDHAYQAAAKLAGKDGICLPDARLRLLVRVG